MAVAALITWLVTAVLGFSMLTVWIRNGGARPGGGSNFRPPVVFGHFLLAAAGLVVWLIYLANDSNALAWIAFADLVVVALIGDLLVYRWYKDRSGVTTTAPGSHEAPGPATPAGGTGLAEQRIPTGLVGAHGVFAVATVVLVLLAALEVGS